MKLLWMMSLTLGLWVSSSQAFATCEWAWNNDSRKEEYICHPDNPPPDPSGEQSPCEGVFDETTGTEVTICR